MKRIGITGGIGAGKSFVLKIIEENCNCVIVHADDVANELKEPGQVCYEPIVGLLSRDVLDDANRISHSIMAEMIFGDEELLKSVNAIIHPAVKQYILDAAEQAELDGCDYFFVEAALLIEDHYDEILDELWYVRAPREVRIERLMSTRGYSRDKALSIIARQLSDEEYIKHTDRVIDNDCSEEILTEQILELIK